MKTSTLLLVLVLAALTARAATNETPAQPGLTPAAEAAARAALQKAYEQGTAATNTAPGRAVPTRVVPGATSNVPATGTVTASPVNAATPAASPAPAPQTPPAPGLPAAAAPAPPAAPPATAAVPPVVPGRPATNALPPGFPGIVRNTNLTVTAGQTNRPTNQATPVPTIPGAPAPGAGRNVAGATPPGAGAGAGAVAVAGAATNQRPDPNEILPAGMIKFQEADLSQVLEIYQELTGRTVLKPASVPQAKISIKTQTELTRAEAVQALDTILAMNGISMVPQGEKFVKAVAEAQAGNQGMRFIDAPIDSLPESATYVTTVVQLTNATPNDILPVLTPFSKAPNGLITIPSTGMIVLRDYAENVKRMLEMIRRIDVVPQQEFESVVIPIKYALAGDIQQVLSSLTAGGGGGGLSVGRSQARTGLSGGGGLGGGLGGGGLGGGLGGGIPGQPGYNPNNPNSLQGGLGGAAGGLGGGAGGRSSFQNRLQQIVNRAATGTGAGGGDIFVLNQTKIIADERINALLIFASKADLVTISNIIDKLDVVLAQVLLEAIIMEVAVGNDLNYGFSYIQTKPTTIGDVMTGLGASRTVDFINQNSFLSGGSNAVSAVSGGFTYFAHFMDFDATVTAIANDSRVNVISRPRIQTSHAVEANLFVGQTRPYVTGSYSYFGGGPQTQFQQQQIGLTLSVLPLINAEGLVVMDIRTKIQQVGEEIKIDANFSVPETIDREANSKVAVRDRETIMLGGFIGTTKNHSAGGIPILKDLPILGALFRSTKEADQRRELIMLIRPTVLPTPQDASTFAAEERGKMPVTRAAEDDYNKYEKKLLDEENRRQERNNRKLYKKEGFSKEQ